jgi:hypothetical protein
LDLQLPVQSVLITTTVVSSNPVYSEVSSIQHYVIKFVNDLQQVGCFLLVIMLYRGHLAINGIRTHNCSGDKH